MSDPRETGWETYGQNNHTKGPRKKTSRPRETVYSGTGGKDRKEMQRLGIPQEKTPRVKAR